MPSHPDDDPPRLRARIEKVQNLTTEARAELRKIADEFDLTSEDLLRAIFRKTLPRPAYNKTQFAPYPIVELTLFKTQCADPILWKQIEAFAEHDGLSPQNWCARAILSTVRCCIETNPIFSPKTGKVLCEADEIWELLGEVVL